MVQKKLKKTANLQLHTQYALHGLYCTPGGGLEVMGLFFQRWGKIMISESQFLFEKQGIHEKPLGTLNGCFQK